MAKKVTKKKTAKKAAKKATTKKTAKKVAKKVAKKAPAKKAAKKVIRKPAAGKKYSFIDDVHERMLEIAEVGRNGEVKIKRTDLKVALEGAFESAVILSAGGDRVRFPVIGTLIRKDVAARKAEMKFMPMLGREAMVSARPASKKPRWSFPKAVREIFSTKKYW